MNHNYQPSSGCMICTICGTAKHKNFYHGFKYWFAGIGYSEEPKCRRVY